MNSSPHPTMQTILVGTDGSDLARRAVVVGRAFAAAAGLPAQVVKITAPDVPSSNAANGCIDRSLAARTPAEGLLDVASQTGTTALCIASHGRGPLGRSLFGSVTAELLRSAPDPLLIVGREFRGASHRRCRWSPDTVVALVDGTSESEAMLPFAQRAAQMLGSNLEVTAVARSEPKPLRGAPESGLRWHEAEYLDRLVQGLDEEGAASLVLRDPIGTVGALRDLTRTPPFEPADTTHHLIVVARSRSGDGQRQIRRIADRVPVPVLVSSPA